MNLKRFDVLLDNKLSVIRFYLSLFFLLVFYWRVIRVVVLLHPPIFISNEMEGRNVRFSMKRKRQCGRIVFCMNLAQLFILSYVTTPWMMFPFKNSRALFCFSSTIDEHTNTAHLIEWFFSNETVTH